MSRASWKREQSSGWVSWYRGRGREESGLVTQLSRDGAGTGVPLGHPEEELCRELEFGGEIWETDILESLAYSTWSWQSQA